MKTVTERKYRFVFDNGYTHDFWFTEVNISWDKATLRLNSLEWKHANGANRDGLFHIVLSQITAIIALEENREVLADEGESQ